MKKLVMTGWSGTLHGLMAAHTAPLMHHYAQEHGAAFSCVNLAREGIPPSWMKVPHLRAALGQFDLVVWLDADVVIVDTTQSIFAAYNGVSSHALVRHTTECGTVPNCGVWMVAAPMAPVLSDIMETSFSTYRDHPWWEQAAVLERLGYAPHVTSGWPHAEDFETTPLRAATQWLDAKWNHHPADTGRVDAPVFRHVTQMEDRLGEIRRLCAQAT